ncbi:MAG TPA: hypothetical protein VMI54_10340 [Polyangiaceae bacterium]|nr:hypothetical protein [Polyangiaceae bacterium]
MKRADRTWFRLSYAVWLFGIFAFFIPAATWSPASRYALTRAIVERHSLSIDAFASSTGDRALVDDQWYTEKAPLPSLVSTVPYGLLHVLHEMRGVRPAYRAHARGETPAVRIEVNRPFQQGLFVSSLATSGIAGAAIGLLLFELLRRRTTARAALLGSLFFTLGTPVFSYGTSLYGHTPAAALLLAGLYLLDSRRSAKDPFPTRWQIVGAGFCLACAPGCEYLAAVPLLLIVGFFLLRPSLGWSRKFQAALLLALGALVPVAVVGAYHTAAFGAPWHTGYSFITNPQFRDGQKTGFLGITSLHSAAVYGLTFGVNRGLFFLAPITLIGFIGLVRRVIRQPDWVARVGLLSFVALFLVNCSYFVWWGGAAAGPRHLVPAVPFLALGLVEVLRTRNVALRALVNAAGVVSVVSLLSLTLVGIEAPEFGNVLTDFVWPNIAAGRISILSGASNLGYLLGFGSRVSTALLVLWSVFGAAYALSLLRRAQRLPPRTRLNATVVPNAAYPAASGSEQHRVL